MIAARLFYYNTRSFHAGIVNTDFVGSGLNARRFFFAMSIMIEPHPFQGAAGKVRYRRILLVVAGSGEGPLTEPTAAAQLCERERVLMPHTRRSQNPSRPAQSGGKPTFRR